MLTLINWDRVESIFFAIKFDTYERCLLLFNLIILMTLIEHECLQKRESHWGYLGESLRNIHLAPHPPRLGPRWNGSQPNYFLSIIYFNWLYSVEQNKVFEAVSSWEYPIRFWLNKFHWWKGPVYSKSTSTKFPLEKRLIWRPGLTSSAERKILNLFA